MLGCRFNAKNTLDKNYLYLAESQGAEVRPTCEVTSVAPVEDAGSEEGGYEVSYREGLSRYGKV